MQGYETWYGDLVARNCLYGVSLFSFFFVCIFCAGHHLLLLVFYFVCVINDKHNNLVILVLAACYHIRACPRSYFSLF